MTTVRLKRNWNCGIAELQRNCKGLLETNSFSIIKVDFYPNPHHYEFYAANPSNASLLLLSETLYFLKMSFSKNTAFFFQLHFHTVHTFRFVSTDVDLELYADDSTVIGLPI